jgi:hypothetical protein
MVIVQYRDLVDPQLIDADSGDGQTHRQRVAEFLATNDAENLSLGIELDVRYDDSPVVVPYGSTAPPWDRRTFVPTVRPAHRAPNIALGERDTPSSTRSTTTVNLPGCSAKPPASGCPSGI